MPKLVWGFKYPIPIQATHREIFFIALKLMLEAYPSGVIETRSFLFMLYGRLWPKSAIGEYLFIILFVSRWTRKELDKTRFFFEWLWLRRGYRITMFPYDEWDKALDAFTAYRHGGQLPVMNTTNETEDEEINKFIKGFGYETKGN